MRLAREVNMKPSAPSSEPTYDPPQVEVVVTADELERESLYAGGGVYGDA